MSKYEKKEIRFKILESQNQKMERLRKCSINEFGLPIPKTHIVRIAISELVENVETKEDLYDILEKYNEI